MDVRHTSDGDHDQVSELVVYERSRRRRTANRADSPRHSGYSYDMKLGREIVQLGLIEYRILRFLAAQPYRACTRDRIAEAVSTHQHRVAPEALDGHVARLRDALGFFRDYVQTVTFLGYRFRD